MIGRLARVSLGIAIVIGGFAVFVIFGTHGVCTTPSGYCIDFPGLEWVLRDLGVAITSPGWWVIITALVKRRSKIR